MAIYTYPRGDLDRPGILLEQLGSFWSSTYEGVFQVQQYAYGRARLEHQTEQNLQEAIDAVSRLTVPVYHLDLWRQLVLKESDLSDEELAVAQYGEGFVYGPQPSSGITLGYGVPQTFRYTFRAAGPIARCPCIFNRIESPSVSLFEGIDYVLDPAALTITFRENPFSSGLFAVRNIYQGDVVVDREASLWGFRAEIDEAFVHTHFGYVLETELESSRAYRDYINGIWDGLVQGGHHLAVSDTLAAVADAPVVRSEQETVVDVLTDANHLLVITDADVYKFSTAATAIVSVGDTVRRGDQLTEAVKIYEFNRGEVDADLLAVTLGKGFLTAGFYEGITFYNKSVPVVVDTSGVFTNVTFELGGWPGDVSKFWNDFHSRGVANGQTLAHLLDTRTNKVGEPVASNLPSTINPLEFLVANVLRNNVFVIKLKPGQFGENRLPLWTINQLRRIVPPHTGYIVITQLEAPDDDIVMVGVGSETEPGYSETLTPYLAAETISEDIDPSVSISEEVIPRHVSGICI